MKYQRKLSRKKQRRTKKYRHVPVSSLVEYAVAKMIKSNSGKLLPLVFIDEFTFIPMDIKRAMDIVNHKVEHSTAERLQAESIIHGTNYK